MATITIRRATEADAEQVAELWRELIHVHLEYDPHFDIKSDATTGFADHIRTSTRDAESLVGVAERDGRLVGFINASLLTRPPCFTVARQGQVWDVFVSRSCRSRGVGRRLVDQALQFFRENAVEFADVRIASGNADAIAFWQRMGMKPYITVGKLKL